MKVGGWVIDQMSNAMVRACTQPEIEPTTFRVLSRHRTTGLGRDTHRGGGAIKHREGTQRHKRWWMLCAAPQNDLWLRAALPS